MNEPFPVIQDYPTDLQEHCRQTAELAIWLGTQLGLPPDVLSDIRTGSLLHDYGKLFFPPALLQKAGKLTEGEREEIRQHPVLGWQALSDIPGLSDTVLDIVLHHHEKLNGSGYPEGTTEIALPVQIVTMADMFDAIHRERPYHPARSLPETISILEQEPGLNKMLIELVRKR